MAFDIQLQPAHRAALANDAALRARFDELLTQALEAGPGSPGGCGNNPFWMWNSAGAELAVERIFSRAEFTVTLERRRAELARAEAA